MTNLPTTPSKTLERVWPHLLCTMKINGNDPFVARPKSFSSFFLIKSRGGAAKVTLPAKRENPSRGTGRWWSATTCVDLPAAEIDRPIIGRSLIGKKNHAHPSRPTDACARQVPPTSHAGGCVSRFASVGCAGVFSCYVRSFLV
nr:hypothetical protein [Pandoravirus massiliensis]